MEAVAPEMPVRSKGAKATVVDDEGGVQKWGMKTKEKILLWASYSEAQRITAQLAITSLF